MSFGADPTAGLLALATHAVARPRGAGRRSRPRPGAITEKAADRPSDPSRSSLRRWVEVVVGVHDEWLTAFRSGSV
jgi:hypothetical protein